MLPPEINHPEFINSHDLKPVRFKFFDSPTSLDVRFQWASSGRWVYKELYFPKRELKNKSDSDRFANTLIDVVTEITMEYFLMSESSKIKKLALDNCDDIVDHFVKYAPAIMKNDFVGKNKFSPIWPTHYMINAKPLDFLKKYGLSYTNEKVLQQEENVVFVNFFT